MFIDYNINLLEHIHSMNTINMYACLIQWMQHRIYIVVLLTDVNTGFLLILSFMNFQKIDVEKMDSFETCASPQVE